MKKAMELSINFLVILIMSLIVFGSGIALVNKFFHQANIQQQELDQETVASIEKLLNDGDRVAIPVNKKNFKIGDQKMFGLGIYNRESGTENFTVTVKLSKGYNLDGSAMTPENNYYVKNYINGNWSFFSQGKNYTIERNKYKSIPILIDVSPNAGGGHSTQDGLYVFDVNVSLDTGELYDEHIHKLYVEVED